MLLKVIFFVLLYFLKALIYATVQGEKDCIVGSDN